MIEILGDYYYIDFTALNRFLMSDESFYSGTTIEREINTTFDGNEKVIGSQELISYKDKPREINAVRYEIIRGFIDDIGGGPNDEIQDPEMGANNLVKMSVRFKIAYNTLYYYGILKIDN